MAAKQGGALSDAAEVRGRCCGGLLRVGYLPERTRSLPVREWRRRRLGIERWLIYASGFV